MANIMQLAAGVARPLVYETNLRLARKSIRLLIRDFLRALRERDYLAGEQPLIKF